MEIINITGGLTDKKEIYLVVTVKAMYAWSVGDLDCSLARKAKIPNCSILCLALEPFTLASLHASVSFISLLTFHHFPSLFLKLKPHFYS